MSKINKTFMEASKLDRGGVFMTGSLVFVDLYNTDPATLLMDDISSALANVMRFGGHTNKRFSVAEHSLIGSYYSGSAEQQMEALLHDAAEAYIGDIISPVKKMFPEISVMEHKLLGTILNKFWPKNPVVQEGIYVKTDYMKRLDTHLGNNENIFLRPHDGLKPSEYWLEQYLNVRNKSFGDGLATLFKKRYYDLLEEVTNG